MSRAGPLRQRFWLCPIGGGIAETQAILAALCRCCGSSYAGAYRLRRLGCRINDQQAGWNGEGEDVVRQARGISTRLVDVARPDLILLSYGNDANLSASLQRCPCHCCWVINLGHAQTFEQIVAAEVCPPESGLLHFAVAD